MTRPRPVISYGACGVHETGPKQGSKWFTCRGRIEGDEWVDVFAKLDALPPADCAWWSTNLWKGNKRAAAAFESCTALIFDFDKPEHAALTDKEAEALRELIADPVFPAYGRVSRAGLHACALLDREVRDDAERLRIYDHIAAAILPLLDAELPDTGLALDPNPRTASGVLYRAGADLAYMGKPLGGDAWNVNGDGEPWPVGDLLAGAPAQPTAAAKDTEPPRHDLLRTVSARLAYSGSTADAIFARLAEIRDANGWTDKRDDELRDLATSAVEKYGGGITIEVDENIPRMVAEAEDALIVSDAGIYQRGGALVRVVTPAEPPSGKIQHATGAPLIVGVPEPAMVALCAAAADWKRYLKGKDAMGPTRPDLAAVRALMHRGEWDFPYLTAIAESPALHVDGSLIDVPGYDAVSGILYAPGDVVFPSIPAAPSRDDAVRACADLSEPFAEFPFTEPHHLAVVLAAILSLAGRNAIQGCVPAFGIDSPTPGSGKGLVADVVTRIATGRGAALLSPSRNNDETRKLLLAVAMGGAPAVLIDNVAGAFGNPDLAAALTAKTISDRVLGKSETKSAPMRAVWLVTGNGLRFKGDLARRVLPVRIDPEVEDPEDRTFRRPDLLRWVKRERPRLLVAALTILRAFIHAGMPPHGKAPMGSFEEWDALVRGALVWCGAGDPCAGRDAVRRDADEDREQIAALLHAWLAQYGSDERLLKKAVEDAKPDLRDALLALGRTSGGDLDHHRVGNAMRRMVGRIVGGLRLLKRTRARRTYWRVEQMRR